MDYNVFIRMTRFMHFCQQYSAQGAVHSHVISRLVTAEKMAISERCGANFNFLPRSAFCCQSGTEKSSYSLVCVLRKSIFSSRGGILMAFMTRTINFATSSVVALTIAYVREKSWEATKKILMGPSLCLRRKKKAFFFLLLRLSWFARFGKIL